MFTIFAMPYGNITAFNPMIDPLRKHLEIIFIGMQFLYSLIRFFFFVDR